MKNWIFVGLPIGAQRHGVELFGPHLFFGHTAQSPEAQKPKQKTNGRYGFEIGRYPTNFCRSCYSNPYFLMGSMLGNQFLGSYLQMPNLFRRSTKRISLLEPQTPQMSYIQSQVFRKISNSKPGYKDLQQGSLYYQHKQCTIISYK